RAEEARPDLERAAVLRPDDVSIDYFLGMGALLSGDSPRVISHMTRFSERSRNADRLVVALQVLADAHQSRGEARPALAALNQLAGLDPKNLIARALVARKRAEMEGFSVAFEAARAAARGPRADAGDHFALGILYAEWPGPGHGLAAIAALGSAAALAPRDRGPVLARARELERAGRPNSARLLLARRLGADPDDAEVLLALAGMERVAGDHSAARRRYNELLEVGARLPRRLRERAELGTLSSLLDEGEPAVAWAWVERLYGSLAPTDPRRLRLASALLRLGRLAEAEAALASLIKASSPARRSVPRGLRARVLLSANDREGARHEYRALVAEVGQGPLPLGLGLWAGVALSDADLPAARKLWRRAASTGPRWGPLAWQTRVCGFLAGDLSAEDVELALRLAEPDERNDARYLLGLGRRLTGVGGQRDFQRALALSARGEFPRRLIERALGE
ncbi:MAG: hypothetical protein JKY65_24865, partial [Planctomycetes bacterium]|nr:hypothetical protein [Planctomycetota bacterium]